MFEPLQALFDKHATHMVEVLKSVNASLGIVIENTLTRMQFDQYGTYSEVGKDKLELQNNEGCYWKVFCTAFTGDKEKPAAVYVGTAAATNLVAVLTPIKLASGAFANNSNQTFFVPPRSTVFVVSEGNISVNLQVERLVENPEYDKRLSMSYDITDIDWKLQEPERHRVRVEKPSPDELRGKSIRA